VCVCVCVEGLGVSKVSTAVQSNPSQSNPRGPLFSQSPQQWPQEGPTSRLLVRGRAEQETICHTGLNGRNNRRRRGKIKCLSPNLGMGDLREKQQERNTNKWKYKIKGPRQNIKPNCQSSRMLTLLTHGIES